MDDDKHNKLMEIAALRKKIDPEVRALEKELHLVGEIRRRAQQQAEETIRSTAARRDRLTAQLSERQRTLRQLKLQEKALLEGPEEKDDE